MPHWRGPISKIRDKKKAHEFALKAWLDRGLSRAVEKGMLTTFADILTKADHRRRADRFLLADSRWRGTRNARIAKARRLLPHLDDADKLRANAMIAVFQRARAAKRLMAKLDTSAKADDWPLYLLETQRLRRAKQLTTAWTRLLEAPTDTEKIVSPDDWWIERRVNAYNALYAGKPKVAYRLVAEIGDVSVNPRNEQAFLAGWIALRHLGNVEDAHRHFAALIKSADGPRTRSRGNYWAARTYEAEKNHAKAREHYAIAAREFNTFYGQLSRQTLNADVTVIEPPDREALTDEIIETFQSRDAVRAIVIASKAGLTNVTRRLLSEMRRTLENGGEIALLAHLALKLGDTQLSVRIGKTGLVRGFRLAAWAYPVGVMPKYDPLRTPPEQAMLYAIARQESEFNTLIHSGAGAQGILQVMPITARHVCRQYKIKCRLKSLKSNPAYNAQLASAYIGDRKDEFSGSYIMTFAGYNAGPGRVRYWMRKIGDPRKRKIDPIDWVESIHIKETREYVKKVLANLQVYRARLGNPEKALTILRDLNRARPPS